MTRAFLILALSAAALSSGCARHGPLAGAPVKTDWRQVITPDDRERLRTWRDAWIAAVTKARTGGQAQAIAAQGDLLDPDRALDTGALPPPGDYRCHVLKIGANGPAMKDYTAYPTAACRIVDEGTITRLSISEGMQRPTGLLFVDKPGRTVFLGAMVFGDETKAMDYGQDTARDMAGYVERIGPKRWRLTLPAPHFEALLSVVDIVPA